jgi:hypothetical protein
MKKDIVIIIDCWSGYHGPTDLRTEMCKNILSSIDEINPALTILASYDTIDIFDKNLKINNPWVTEYWKYFFDCPDLSEHGKRYTHEILLNATTSGKQIAIQRIWQFEYVIQQLSLDVDRIWYFGIHWNACLRDRELGWYNIKNYARQVWKKDIDILFKDNCTLKIPFEKFELSEEWPLEEWPMIGEDFTTSCLYVGDHTWKLC